MSDPIPRLKDELAAHLLELFEGEPQWTAASYLEVTQPRISELRNGKLERFSLEMLIRLMARANRRVELRIEYFEYRKSFRFPPPRGAGVGERVSNTGMK
jgi:predicted XRE-type DNA-binding protein